MNDMIVIKINKTISLFDININLDLELIMENNINSIFFIFYINNLRVSGMYRLDKFITYGVDNGILSENIVKKLQEELKIIYLDNF